MDELNQISSESHSVDIVISIPDKSSDAILSVASFKFHARRAIRFGLVSGMGLVIDLSLFLILVRSGVAPFVANITSSGAGLTFVYCASVRRVFRYHGRFIVPLFAAYLLYHVCGTLVVSEVISRLIQAGVPPALAKIGILPATFGANYFFMSWMTRRRERWVLQHP